MKNRRRYRRCSHIQCWIYTFCALLTIPGIAPAEPAPAASAKSAGASQSPTQRRRAPSIDLNAPVAEDILNNYLEDVDRTIEHRSDQASGSAIQELGADINQASLPEAINAPFLMLGTEVPAGTSTRLAWQPGESFTGIAVPTPVLVVHGASPGPVLCITAAVHGDELNGIEMVRRVLYDLDATQLKGTVVGVPIVNLQGFKRGSRYLPDRRDLNRYFPGNPRGSSASRIAYSFFNEIVLHCNYLVDLHTGSFYRTNLPQLRADLREPGIVEMAQSFASTAIVHSPGATGTLRRAAVEAGIPSVTLEAGEPLRVQSRAVEHGARAVNALIDQLGMYRTLRVWGNPAPVHYKSRWVRTDSGGILGGQVKLGEMVKKGDFLGSVTDPITNVRADILSPWDGRIIGMAVDQFVMPGFAAFHVGIETTTEDLFEPAAGEPGTAKANQPERDESDDPEARDSLEDS